MYKYLCYKHTRQLYSLIFIRTDMQKLRVGVFMGGKSIEKEVSFNSGRTVCDHLDTSRYEVIPIFQTAHGMLYVLPLHFLHRGKISDFEHRLAQEAEPVIWDNLPKLVDFVYICVHGNYAEDGVLQGFFEVLGIPYLGSKVLSSALSMNKVMQKEILHAHGIAVPRGITLNPHEIAALDNAQLITHLAKNNIQLPCVVKPYKEGSSLGVCVVWHQDELLGAVQHACTINPHKQQTVLIEEKVVGMEFSCITITDYKTNTLIPLPPTEIVPEDDSHFFDYEQKYMPGRATKNTPPHCSSAIIKKIQDTCVQVMRVLGITNISRIDGFVTADEQIIIIDPNSLSGMGPSSFVFREAAEINISHTQLINHLIETELHAYGMLDALVQQEQLQQQEHTMEQKIRVAVLMGGNSNEKEISLESGRNVVYKLSPHKYEVLPLFVDSNMCLFHINQSLLVRNSTKEITSLLQESMQVAWHDLPHLVDFVFIALHGGNGENGAIQGTLEMLGLPYNGSSVLTSALCMDKYKTTQFLRSQQFDVPNSMIITHEEWHQNHNLLIQSIEHTIGFPCIVKPHNDGCSVMVEKINTSEELTQHIESLFAQKNIALVEEFITGMELTVGVIGNEEPRALPPSQAVTTHTVLSMQEKFLPGAGENQTPAPLPTQALQLVQQTIERAYSALQCKGYARIDCFYQTATQSPTRQERIIILEVNTLPALTPATCIFHQALEVGIKPMDFIDKIIEFGMQEHGITIKSATALGKEHNI